METGAMTRTELLNNQIGTIPNYLQLLDWLCTFITHPATVPSDNTLYIEARDTFIQNFYEQRNAYNYANNNEMDVAE